MQTSSPDVNRTKKLALGAAFLCAALMLSLAESFIFPGGILPIPGAKPGLANAAVLLCATLLGYRYSAAVSFGRIILMFFLFGNGTSILYALSGGILSFIGILATAKNTKLSFLGKSVISAILHNTAQVLCASLIIDNTVLYLIPWMIITAVLCGSITGILLNITYEPIFRYYKKAFKNT